MTLFLDIRACGTIHAVTMPSRARRSTAGLQLAALAGRRTAVVVCEAWRHFSFEEIKCFLSVVGGGSKNVPPEIQWQVRLDLEWRYYESLVKKGERWTKL